MGQGYYNQSEVTALGDIAGGIKVERAAAAVTTGVVSLFTIIGGRIVLRDIVGEVTATIGANLTLIHLEAVSAIGTVHMSVDSGDIVGDVLAVKYMLPATAAGASYKTTGDAGLGVCPRWIILPGTIGLHASATPVAGGLVKWTIMYVPFDIGAYIEAA